MVGKYIVVWFSCGAASAVAAKRTIQRYGKYNRVVVVNTPIKEEDPDNRRFLIDVEKWIGQKILLAVNSNFPNSSCVEVWEKRKYMSGTKGAPCTQQLKKEARYQWTDKNHPDYHVLGFTEDESARHKLFVITEIPNVIPVLIEDCLSKDDCYEIIQRAGILLPASYRQGYNNANCKGCVKATSPTYWNRVRVTDPDVFNERAVQSRKIGCRLTRVKGKRIFLDELDPMAKGRPIKLLKSVECGIFCETPIKP
jgi:hypothetical protein